MPRAPEKSTLHWLLLIHAIPPTPAYFRAKVGKRLAKVGAVAIKNSVYVLPLNEETREDFQWMAREIVQDGGEATVVDAMFVEGMQNDHVEALFRAARHADYVALADDARGVVRELGAKPKKGELRASAEGDLAVRAEGSGASRARRDRPRHRREGREVRTSGGAGLREPHRGDRPHAARG